MRSDCELCLYPNVSLNQLRAILCNHLKVVSRIVIDSAETFLSLLLGHKTK